ncbi:hypothetical protein QE152_g19185 [Popillia japonica]|uniref:Uncharacterized protein n=1 Tax=Popillia japonica TaxID=7064 RepID=A0AAW1L0Q2_POPJA
MKVFTILFIVGFGHTLAEHSIWKRASDDYPSENSAKSATQTESSSPSSPGGYNPVKYQSPPYVAPQRVQYTPQQLNYVVQPTYKYLQQSTAPVSPAPYVHQQTQQQPQYTQQNIAYNPQPVSKISAFPQKVYTPAAPTPAPYSLAGDVSSFKYTSPIVSYSNLGVIQQNLGKSSAPAQQEAQTRPSYSQLQSQAAATPQHNPVPQPIYTQSQPQSKPQLVYRPRYQLPQVSYNPAPQQHIPVPVQPQTSSPKYIYTQQSASIGQNQGGPSAKLIYNQQAPVFASVSRPQQPTYQVATQKLAASAPQQFLPVFASVSRPQQPTYQVATQKLAASAPQQFLYTLPQQVAYSPAHSQQEAQPVQPLNKLLTVLRIHSRKLNRYNQHIQFLNRYTC